MRLIAATAALTLAATMAPASLIAQGRSVDLRPAPGEQGSRNVKVMSHIALPGMANIEIEQELSRPYAYVSAHRHGYQIISVKDPSRAQVIYSWNIENPEIHVGSALDGRYAKLRGRYFYIQSFEFQPTGPDASLGAIVFDVTGLPDTTKVRETARIHTPEYPRGFHSIFAYKHSDGRALLLAAMPYAGPYTYVYDIAKLAGGDTTGALVGRIPRPDTVRTTTATRYPGYHDFYVHYDVAGKRDLFYGAGLTGFYVFDISSLESPKLVTRVFGTPGMDIAHTFTPDPTGRYAVTEMEYSGAPLRIFDLKPDGKSDAALVSRPIGAWTARWQDMPHNHEVRWPYVFVSGYNTGMQVFNMMDPTNPYTVGYHIPDGGSTWGVDVRNADGLIVTSDRTGFWAYRLEGFDGWNGHQWGLPNVSSVQDWDNGPEGAPRPARIS